jgi:glycosyltransferase involved in cell wall biosynthesis
MTLLQRVKTQTELKRPYRVALIHPTAGISNGGSQLSAIDMARHLSQHFQVELLSGSECGSFSHPVWSIPRNQSYKFFQKSWLHKILNGRITYPENLLEHLTSFIPCIFHLLRSPVDLIYPNNSYGGLAVAKLIRVVKGTPFIYTEREGVLGGNKCLIRHLKFKPNHLIVFNEAAASIARSISPNQLISVIPNGVDLNRFSSEGSMIDIGLQSPIVLCVASLNRSNHKRIELAIQAVAKLQTVSLLVCGDGPDRSYFENLGYELLDRNRFKVVSFPFEDMPAVYRSVDLFTLPSKDEPFGRVYIEAMASGLPIVAPDDGARRQIIANSGLFCNVDDVNAYAVSIQQALSQEWGDIPRTQASKFEWGKIVLAYKDIITNTIEISAP